VGKGKVPNELCTGCEPVSPMHVKSKNGGAAYEKNKLGSSFMSGELQKRVGVFRPKSNRRG